MGEPTNYQFDLPTSNTPSGVTIPEQWYPGVQNYWARSTSQRIVGDHINGVVAVVIHATAGSNSSGAISVMNPPPGGQAASFHWLVPDEDEPQHGSIIWACVRERDAAWHVRTNAHHPDVNGDRVRVNHWSLGIEVVNRQTESGSDSFSDWQVAVTAQIVRYCWAKYPNLKHIVSHARLDPTRRTDPGSIFPWERFKEIVLNVSQDPFDAIAFDALNLTASAAIDAKETASLEEEEANFELEDAEVDKLHEVKED